MFLLTVRTPSFSRSLPPVDAQHALEMIWAFAEQGFDLTVLDVRGREVSMSQIETSARDAARRQTDHDAPAEVAQASPRG